MILAPWSTAANPGEEGMCQDLGFSPSCFKRKLSIGKEVRNVINVVHLII